MAPHSSTLAWKIPWMEEPGKLQFMGSLRVGHDWTTPLSFFTFMHWRRKWHPTPVLLSRKSRGQGSLVGCRLWGRTESDTTEVTWQQSFSILSCKEYNQSILVLTIWWYSFYRVATGVGKGCFLWQVYSLVKILLAFFPVSFLTPRPNLPVIPGISWLPTFAFLSPVMKRTSLFGVSSRRSCRSSKNHSTLTSSALVVGHRLGLLWYWMVCLGNEQRSFCHFWDCTQVLHFGLFCWLWELLHFF